MGFPHRLSGDLLLLLLLPSPSSSPHFTRNFPQRIAPNGIVLRLQPFMLPCSMFRVHAHVHGQTLLASLIEAMEL